MLERYENLIDEIIKKALREDVGEKDITSEFLFPENFNVKGVLISKEEGIICGIEIFKKVFYFLSPLFNFKFFFNEGEKIGKNITVAEIYGPVKELLAGERVSLNFLQHLSGIATETRKFVKKVGNKVKIYDTRKTTPNLRILEKYAVKIGGGENHRFGLFDMVLIKENHITALMQKENISREKAVFLAVKRAKEKSGGEFKIEVEVENFKEAKKAFEAGADIIMFDNTDKKELIEFIDFLKDRRKEVEIEWSGNVNLENIEEIKKLPVDRISVGSITHSPRALDFSIKIRGQTSTGRK